MTVKLVENMPIARTSFACRLHGRYIYVVGGNTM